MQQEAAHAVAAMVFGGLKFAECLHSTLLPTPESYW